jgi:hypothetical protein
MDALIPVDNVFNSLIGAPILAGWPSPLRMATGGKAKLGVRQSLAAARQPARINGAATSR